MKILALFLDMLGTEYINLGNKKINKTAIDELIQEMGGIFYSNCYSPAPDTPRCSACMWTGLYPKRNKCDSRLKWPQNLITQKIDNIWNVLKEKKYRVNIYMNESTNKLGLIPLYGEENVYQDTIYQFFNEAEIVEDSFNFFYLPDIHYYMDEVGYSEKKSTQGIKYIVKTIKKIFEFYNAKETFDYIFMFSDHGFQETKKENRFIINDERVKTFMFIREKGVNSLSIDEQLRSNLDFAPTIYSILGYVSNKRLDGKSLLSCKAHDYVLIEEMDKFSCDISQTVEHWCVVTKNNKYWLECSGKWFYQFEDKSFNEKKYEKIIIKKMNDYKKNHSVFETAMQYRQYIKEHLVKDCYSDGSKFGKNAYLLSNLSILKNKRVVLYGAGRVGKDLYKQLIQEQEIEIVGWIDINYQEIGLEKVKGLDFLLKIEYDYVLICMDNEKIIRQAQLILQQIGVNCEKIYWEKPDFVRISR